MSEEIDLINRVVDVVIDLDPDIITGWDIELSSWGYLDSRAETYGKNTDCSPHAKFISPQASILPIWYHGLLSDVPLALHNGTNRLIPLSRLLAVMF